MREPEDNVPMSVDVHHHSLLNRYEARVGDELAGIAEYHLSDGVLTFTHTEVGDAFKGQGVGSALARFGLDDARAQGLRVRPQCPFIAGWIKRHPDYADLVA